MNIIIELSNDLERRLQSHLGTLSQRALEAVAVEAYRSQLISAAEVQQMLHLSSRLATDAFLKQHEAYLHYTEADIEQDLQAIDRALPES
jgi:predicted HTH domain antitoxin